MEEGRNKGRWCWKRPPEMADQNHREESFPMMHREHIPRSPLHFDLGPASSALPTGLLLCQGYPGDSSVTAGRGLYPSEGVRMGGRKENHCPRAACTTRLGPRIHRQSVCFLMIQREPVYMCPHAHVSRNATLPWMLCVLVCGILFCAVKTKPVVPMRLTP